MTDDISKVVRFRCPTCGAAEHSRERRPNGNSKCVAGHSYPSRDAIDSSANRLESATTPAAINPASVDNQFTYSPIEPPYRLTPAITTDGHAGVALDPEGSYTYYNDYATLARQLAEANSELVNLRAANIAYAGEVANLYGRAGLAESQLAEATRRLGEVEGLVGKWRECAEDNAARGELIQAGKAVAYTDCADELEAALTKEPTK